MVTDGTEFVNILGIKTNVDLFTLVHKMEQDKCKDHESKSNHCTFQEFRSSEYQLFRKNNQEFIIDLHLKSENMVIFHKKLTSISLIYPGQTYCHLIICYKMGIISLDILANMGYYLK